MPWLTGIVAVMLVILICLGVWQFQRLQWKTNLLTEVEASVTSPPLTSLEDLERAIAANEPVDFRRIYFEARPLPDRPIYAVYKTQQGGIFWDLFRQYDTIFGRYDTVENAEKPDGNSLSPHRYVAGHFVGYVREDHPMGRVEGWLKSKPNRTTNRWFKFNQTKDWGTEKNGIHEALDPNFENNVRTTHYVEIESYSLFNTADRGASAAAALPVRRPSIRNNHRDYMLTWFSFAFLLVIFYLMIHRRAGRLTW
jgi:cytochrome oxidase assembly protein ShyY1